MKFWFVLVIIVLLFGCDKVGWEGVPARYVCTEQQMARVEKETVFCTQNTSFFKSYCYTSAIERNCTPKKGE